MALNLAEKVKELLENNSEQRFTAREIATWIFETYPEQCRKKQTRSTATVNPIDNDHALLQQIVAEIGSQRPRLQKRHPQIKTTEGRPRKYYYTEKTDASEVEAANIIEIRNSQSDGVVNLPEYALYPKLSEFLWSELHVYSKRIDEKKSRNLRGAGGNKWLYPDIVGMENLSSDWHREIKDCVQQYADKKTKLWSFEVKTLVNRSNVREVFFQAVSNSSWANFGYLGSGLIN